MYARVLAAAALAVGMAFAPGASAMGPQVFDKADDANYLNDNSPVQTGQDHPLNDNPTPYGSSAHADIQWVKWESWYGPKKVLKGYTVTMKLKAPPNVPGVLYRALARTDTCSTVWLQYHSSKPQHTPQGNIRYTCDGGSLTPGSGTAKVVAIHAKPFQDTIVWRVELGRGAPPGFGKGTEMVELSAHTRDFVDNPQCLAGDPTRCTTSPTQYDVTETATTSYKLGS